MERVCGDIPVLEREEAVSELRDDTVCFSSYVAPPTPLSLFLSLSLSLSLSLFIALFHSQFNSNRLYLHDSITTKALNIHYIYFSTLCIALILSLYLPLTHSLFFFSSLTFFVSLSLPLCLYVPFRLL